MVHVLRILAIFCLCVDAFAKMPEMTYVVETVVVISRPQFLIERRYIGTIKAEKFSLLSPKIAGTVATIDVKAGQRVKKGQLILTLTSNVEKKSVELAEKSLKLAQEKLSRSRTLYKSNDITRSQLDEVENEVLLAKTKLESHKQLKENVELRAPFDGVVGVPRVVLGESVQSQSSVISIMDGAFSVFINIPSSRLAEVKVGQPVRMKSQTATVSAVERSIDPITRTGFATVTLPSCDTCIVGDSIYANISVLAKTNALLINKNAIYYKNQKPFIVVVTKGEGEKRVAEHREIVIGEEQEGDVEVISGVTEGEEIVVANPKRIPDRASLTVAK